MFFKILNENCAEFNKYLLFYILYVINNYNLRLTTG